MREAAIKCYLGFAIKMRKVVYGVDGITMCYPSRKPFLVLIDKNLSDNSRSKLNPYLDKYDIPRFIIDMKVLFPDRNCKAVGIQDRNLSMTIEQKLKEIENG